MSNWNDGHQVEGQDARRYQDTGRFIYGCDGGPGKPGHGETISHDGLNANYVRDPGGYVPVDDRQADPYAGYQSQHPRHNYNHS